MIEWLHFHFSLSCIGEGNGNPLQCSCLENPRDGGARWAAVYGVTQSRTRLKWLSSSSTVIYPWPRYYRKQSHHVKDSFIWPFLNHTVFQKGFPGGSAGKESTCNAGDLGSIPGLGRSPGEGNAFVILPAIMNIPVRPHPQQNLVFKNFNYLSRCVISHCGLNFHF